jgi:Ala-tRNA(Pro) deacylase
MPMTERLHQFLQREQAAYRTVPHQEAYTAQAVATATHVGGRQIAKVVVARDKSGHYLMLVLPGSCRADLAALRDIAGTGKLTLASETEVAALFPDTEVGAEPPFGGLWDLPVYVDRCFARHGEVFFKAGNHHEVVAMPYEAYERLARPVVGEFCLHARPDSLLE